MSQPTSAKVLFDAKVERVKGRQAEAVLLPEDRLVLSSRRVQIAASPAFAAFRWPGESAHPQRIHWRDTLPAKVTRWVWS